MDPSPDDDLRPGSGESWTEADEEEFRRTHPRPPTSADEELLAGFRQLAHVGKAVSIFGSARTPRDDPMYAKARETAAVLGSAGFSIITGGGPGIMEAGNRGARDAGVPSI